MGTNRQGRALLPALLLALGPIGARAQDAPPVPVTSGSVFGVIPFRPAAQLESIFAPVGGMLGRALGREFRYRSAAAFEWSAARIVDGAQRCRKVLKAAR